MKNRLWSQRLEGSAGFLIHFINAGLQISGWFVDNVAMFLLLCKTEPVILRILHSARIETDKVSCSCPGMNSIQGSHRLEQKYLNVEGFLEKYFIKSALKSTGKSLKRP